VLWLHRVAWRPLDFQRQVGLDGLEPHVRCLMESRSVGSVLVLEREGSTGVLELTRLADRSIRLRIPDVPWSTTGIADAERSLCAAGFRPGWEGGSGRRKVRRSLRVAAGDVANAVRAVRITAAALEWPASASFTVHLERS
jgi:hypothetical protein